MPADHFVTGEELSPTVLDALLARASVLRRDRGASRALAGRAVALIFEQPSTRTRVSFQVAVAELGGTAVVANWADLQVADNESIRDTAWVLGEYVDIVAVRAREHDRVAEFADHAGVPVINLMTGDHHPCQALADLLTLREHFATTRGVKVAFVGEGTSNVATSLMLLGSTAGCEVVVACPQDFSPSPDLLRRTRARVTGDPSVAAEGAHAVYVDAWVCSTDTPDQARHRRRVLEPYRLDEALLASARSDAIVLHCLPAHPGDEIAQTVLYGRQSAVRHQTQNRLHAHKALLELLVS